MFVFDDARQAREFGTWIESNTAQIAAQAETTTSVGKLRNIEQYAAARMRYLRFNYTTGDAVGQNMVGKATFVACEWIVANYPGIRCNMLSKARSINQVGSFMAGSNNTGAHSANGITAIFIATGQDVANVAESSAAIVFADMDDEGNYYLSITIPSLIVATCGGGTGLPTQQECLNLLGCNGAGKVYKLAEIMGATVLAGEISLMSAVLAGDWVTSHDALGRNR